MHRWFTCVTLSIVVWTWISNAAARADDDSNKFSPAAAAPARMLAHWGFDDKDPSTIAAASEDPSLQIDAAVERKPGVIGSAIQLSGADRLPCRAISSSQSMPQIAFSAWVRPTDLSGYREIYRQECPERLLFSFQGGGSILSLGLNINGYVECDAPIDPSQVVDGTWHHVAAAFDGKVMRVFLDGREVGHLDRPGVITTNPHIQAFVGSSGGAGEHFQGGMDDLRIYATALSENQVASLYQQGLEQLKARFATYDKKLAEVYQPAATFARSLARIREAMLTEQLPKDSADTDFMGLLLTRLRADFPRESAEFARVTGASPLQYLKASSHESLVALVKRYVEMMQEYKPLTPRQIERETADQRQYWAEVDQIAQAFSAMQATGETAGDAEQWIDILLAAARHTQQRPTVSEAVAPYRTPTTPVTRDLNASEASEVLQRDWLHQADGNPSKERIVLEIQWARQLAARIRETSQSQVDLTAQAAALDDLERQAALVSGADEKLYYRVRELKRSIALRNPVIDFDSVLFVDMPFPDGSEWAHETRHRLGYMAVPGARLMVLEGLSPAGHLRQLMPQAPLHGSFWRPDLSWDAQKVLFCYKPHNEKSFHLYEINLDGSGLVQLTDGPYDDLDPIYLPDGKHLMFSTTRGHTYVRCMPPTNAFVLRAAMRMDETSTWSAQQRTRLLAVGDGRRTSHLYTMGIHG